LIPPTTCCKLGFFIVGLWGERIVYDWLQTHWKETLSTLPICPDKMELFDMIKCSLDTKIISKRVLLRIPLNWCSTLFTKPARHLDQIQINKMLTLKGPLHIQAFTLEKIHKPSPTQVVSTPFNNVPLNLPINCYSPEYLTSISEQQQQLLCTRPV
ncbi:hypothetical protein VP01_6509g1, partial [Puccinia sorghi]